MNRSKSETFKSYNHIKSSDRIEPDRKRTDRALGLVQGETHRPYRTTESSCTCKDYTIRLAGTGRSCKHMKALRIRNDVKRGYAAQITKSQNLCAAALEVFRSHRHNWTTGETLRIWESSDRKRVAFLSVEHGRVMLRVSGYPRPVRVGSTTRVENQSFQTEYEVWANNARKHLANKSK